MNFCGTPESIAKLLLSKYTYLHCKYQNILRHINIHLTQPVSYYLSSSEFEKKTEEKLIDISLKFFIYLFILLIFLFFNVIRNYLQKQKVLFLIIIDILVLKYRLNR